MGNWYSSSNSEVLQKGSTLPPFMGSAGMPCLMEDTPLTAALAKHLLDARFRDHTLGTRSLGREGGRHL